MKDFRSIHLLVILITFLILKEFGVCQVKAMSLPAKVDSKNSVIIYEPQISDQDEFSKGFDKENIPYQEKALNYFTVGSQYYKIKDYIPQSIPSGYYLVSSGIGVYLYRKDFSGGAPNFVQIIDLDQNASLQLLHGQLYDLRVGLGPYGGNDASFFRESLSTAWLGFSANYSGAFCLANAQFFNMKDPARLAFPLKKDGQILSDGYGSIAEYPGQTLILEIWNDHADIVSLSRDNLYNSTAPNILGGLSEYANKGITNYTGRTFIGIDDADGNGFFEKILVFSSAYSTQVTAADALRSFGAEKVIMLDGGGSTQLRCGSTNFITTSRTIPQTIGAVEGSPDGQAPISTATLAGASGENGFFVSNVSVTITALDDLSGVASSYFNLNFTGWQLYTSPVLLLTNGQHTFQYYSVDNVGNTEVINTLAPINIDLIPPTNPTEIDPGCNATSGVWQRTCPDANFSWSGASDETSGLASYQYYWGTDPEGSVGIDTNDSHYDPPPVTEGAYYLRLRTRDVAGNWSKWQTMYILQYDTSSPSGSVVIQNDQGVTDQALVRLDTVASDDTSGVYQMRLRDEGGSWSEWQAYATGVEWILPPRTAKEHKVEVQYRDRAGNESAIKADTIYLDIYPDHPSSENYILYKSTFGMSGTNATSRHYGLVGTLGQVSATGNSGSTGYRMTSGYWSWIDELLVWIRNYLPVIEK